MTTPRITVLLSVHNGGRWLRAAIESVLAQTWRNFEFLILDDASTDDSAAQIESFRDPRIQLIRLPENIGLTRSLNVGLREARGEFTARQDADDLSAPERLEKQVAFLDAHSGVPLVGAQARLIDEHGRSRGVRDLPLEPVAVRWLSLLDNPIIHTAVMFRTSVIRDELAGYDESFPCCQDYDLWARVLMRHPAVNLAPRLVAVREHGGSISATRQAEAREMVRRVVRGLADAWLPGLALEDEAVARLCAFRWHLTPEEVAPFHALLARVEAEFAVRFPAAHGSADLSRTRAAVFARLGYNLITSERGLAAAELLRALRASPRIATHLPWLRMAALFLLGDRARRLAGRTPNAAELR
jgi:glycosyltransferase involved in cell wall biosynthesis